jgi:hypothetical protein
VSLNGPGLVKFSGGECRSGSLAGVALAALRE